MTETTLAEKDGYWYRVVLDIIPFFKYSWGTKDMDYVYRADLEWKGRGKYVLRNRTLNGRYYKKDQAFKPRHAKKCHGYDLTLRLVERLLEWQDERQSRH